MATRTYKGGIPRLVMGRDDAPEEMPLARPQVWTTESAVIGHKVKVEVDHLATEIAKRSRDEIKLPTMIEADTTDDDRILGIRREKYTVGGRIYYRAIRTLDLDDEEPTPLPSVRSVPVPPRSRWA